MRRRDLLKILGATASLGVLRRTFGQPPAVRGAVVIGVNRSGNLPVLNAAAAGARQVGSWLRQQGFQVTELIDDVGTVTASAVFDAVDGLTRLDTLDQLLIYFSGHGFLMNFSEHWLLSRAPQNPNESISTVESVALARRTEIPNVVFVSDACRSTADSLAVQGMHGSLIFPSSNAAGASVEVDQFFATIPGSPALELPVAESVGRFDGIFTAAFLDAFQHPDPEMVKTVGGVSVVPNRLLKSYLSREVPRRAEEHSIALTQQPEARIESGDSTYIGMVDPTSGDDPSASPSPTPATTTEEPASIVDVAVASLEAAGLPTRVNTRRPPATEVAAIAMESGFSEVRGGILASTARTRSQPVRFETRTGILVYGAVVTAARSRPEGVELLDRGDGDRPAVIRCPRWAASVALRFGDESGTVIASVPEHLATVTVRGGGVGDLNYVTDDLDPETAARLDQLRASVATAAQFGAFHFEGDFESRSSRAAGLADRIRVLKGIDPSLGLYAAYAYFEAGLTEQVRSVRSWMRGSLGFDLFDVAMLAGDGNRRERIEPAWPMLAQGWGLLRVNGVELRGALLEASNRLRPALWTTFDPRGMTIVEELLQG